MSDELTFLRWFYRNADRFACMSKDETGYIDWEAVRIAYQQETGSKVPGDYRREVTD